MDIEVPPEQAYALQTLLLETQREWSATILEDILQKVSPEVWVGGTTSKSKEAMSIKVSLRPGAKIPNIKEQAKCGVQPLLTDFLEYVLICPCWSPCSTPILPVQKPDTDEYQFMQDLRANNQILEDIHPVVPNPYTLLTTLSRDFLLVYHIGFEGCHPPPFILVYPSVLSLRSCLLLNVKI